MFYQDIVPAAEIYKYKWYRPICENDWYYYRPRTTPLTNQDNKEIYKTIDQELKKIFSFVVSKGYTTLPSCQGHFHSTNDLLRKYYNTLVNLKTIKTDGLLLADTETGKQILFQDENYRNPWSCFDDFLNSTQKVMSNGYFGIVNPKLTKPYQDDSIKIDIDNSYFGIPVANVNVFNKNGNSVKQNWDRVYDILKSSLI
jgi:hypothetical protein